jgi:hypothetical protein
LLGDGETDKFEFKVDAVPAPDGTTVRFFAGQTRVVEGSLHTYLAGAEITPDHIMEVDGLFDMTAAPAANAALQTSFYYEWFLDSELQGFIDDSGRLLGYTGLADALLPLGVRPVLLDFACYYAYMRKAAEAAANPLASAAGYTADQSRPSPNWLALAKMALETAQMKLKLYGDNPLLGSGKPSLRFVTLRMSDYMPRS